MFFFETRSKAREFAGRKDDYKFKDEGVNAKPGFRWGVKVF